MNFAVGIIIFILIVVGWLALVRWYLPDVSCRWCRGRGKRWGSNRKRSGPCFFCKGSGKRKSKKQS